VRKLTKKQVATFKKVVGLAVEAEQLKRERNELSEAHTRISATSKELAKTFGNAKEPSYIAAKKAPPPASSSV
jgi:hypothetical protein